MLLRAKYVLPVDRPPIKNGAVGIEGPCIAAVGSAKSLDGTPVIDFGDAAILPGLVNAHTHLELSYCQGKLTPKNGFTDWLKGLLATKSECLNSPEAQKASTRMGIRQSLAAGVTTVGDITARPQVVRPELRHGPLRVVSFGEVIAIGTRRGLLGPRLQAAIDGRYASDSLAVAVSPHAPYSVEPDGIRACSAAARQLNMPICMHLAETPYEADFTERGQGPLRDLLEHMGLIDSLYRCPRLGPVALVHGCGVLSQRTILAHCNYVCDDDISLLAASGSHVAYCPRTHAAFGHERHPFSKMLEAGINVCVGTDSLASAPSLSVLEEIRYLHQVHPDFDRDLLIKMATISGAAALSLSTRIGTLTPGKCADMTVIPLDPTGPSDPIENLLSSSLQPLATYIAGRRV